MKLKNLSGIYSLLSLVVSICPLISYAKLSSFETENDDETIFSKPFISIAYGKEQISFTKKNNTIKIGVSRYSYRLEHDQISNNIYRVGIGDEILDIENWRITTSLNYSRSKSFYITGTQTLEQSPGSYDYYKYGYQLSLEQLMIDTKLYLVTSEYIQPFAKVGLGISKNKLAHFKSTSPTLLVTNLDFGTNQTINKSYNLGTGLLIALNENINLSFELDFTNYGTAKGKNGAIWDATYPYTEGQRALKTMQFETELIYYW